MKVIKRDGRVVDYDKSKIKIAIEKANKEVGKKEKATKEDIKNITEYIEELNKKRILVEDIQDIIEQKLMELGRYELAKKYIVYRYTRALIRKSNTTDASILGLIRNANRNIDNKNAIMAYTQRNLIVGEVSKDLSKRILLPEKIVKAWDEGALYFHNAEYFIQPIINSCFVKMDDMLDNGTMINDKMIETPKSFQVACIVMTQIISNIACNQYGEQIIDIGCLGKYLRKSKEKFEKELLQNLGENLNENLIKKIVDLKIKLELKAGIQTIQYQINTQLECNPQVTFLLQLKENDEYIEENEMIIQEVLEQRRIGIKNELGETIIPNTPKLLYVLNEQNCLNGGKYDYLTKKATEYSSKYGFPNYVSEKYEIEYKFNQGIVTINLPQIAIISEGNEENFWSILEERLELCKDALMYRYYSLKNTTSDISPIHWRYGAISRLEKGEKIDQFLESKFSNLYLGYLGISEMIKMMKGVSTSEQDGEKFAIKVIEYLKNKVLKWKKETNIGFELCGTVSEQVGKELMQIDKENFGTIEGITNIDHYTNSYYINEEIDELQKLKIESEIQKASDGIGYSLVNIKKINNIEELIKTTFKTGQCIYIK